MGKKTGWCRDSEGHGLTLSELNTGPKQGDNVHFNVKTQFLFLSKKRMLFGFTNSCLVQILPRMVVLCRAVVCAQYQLLASTPVSKQSRSPGGQL